MTPSPNRPTLTKLNYSNRRSRSAAAPLSPRHPRAAAVVTPPAGSCPRGRSSPASARIPRPRTRTPSPSRAGALREPSSPRWRGLRPVAPSIVVAFVSGEAGARRTRRPRPSARTAGWDVPAGSPPSNANPDSIFPAASAASGAAAGSNRPFSSSENPSGSVSPKPTPAVAPTPPAAPRARPPRSSPRTPRGHPPTAAR